MFKVIPASPEQFGVSKLPILSKKFRLAEFVIWDAKNEDHSVTPADVLAQSRQRPWIMCGRYFGHVTNSYMSCLTFLEHTLERYALK